jgi:penicillin amidase
MRRILVASLAVVVVLLVIIGVGWLYVRSSLPQISGRIEIAGLDGPVEIVRDADGVPHIFATTDHDAIFALGYVHAQDRLWQMEMNRRIGAGRLSEILGEQALPTDKFLRTLGAYRATEASWSSLEPRTQMLTEAYVAGINSWLAEGHTLPPEFLLLGFTPQPWTVTDSLVWGKMTAWDLSSNYDLDLLRARLTQAIGAERTAQLLPAYPKDGITILDAVALSPAGVDAMLALDTQMQQAIPLRGLNVGSNNWVVSGKLTESGLPLLANDPHLGARIPAIWYLAEVQGETLHVTGATLPGLPFFPIGHNEQIAWGVTNTDPDVQDVYVERINPANPNQVEVDGRWVDMGIVEEAISVKGETEPIHWAARSTRHGPMIGDAIDLPLPVALRWTGLDANDTTVDAFVGVNYASNWEDFRSALRRYVAPSQNFVYADKAGNIGYFAPGHIPLRAHGDGMLPVSGWNSEYEWTGWIPFDELPQAWNPPAGYIATANNRVVSDGYPYLITNDWAPPYRAQRIVQLLGEMNSSGGKLTRDHMIAIQADQTSLQARQLLPWLLTMTPKDERQAQALAYLRQWNGESTRSSLPAAIYYAWYTHLGYALFEDDLQGDLYEALQQRSHELFLAEVMADPERYAGWCDNVLSIPLESCADTAQIALDSALDDLSERLGPDMTKWTWGALHQTQYRHTPFSDVALLRPLFHRTIANGGDDNTVNAAPIQLDGLYNQDWVVSYRQIVDMADFNHSLFMQTTGQSGNVLSGHYDDFIDRHRDVAYLPMTFGRDPVTGSVLRLVPKNK